MKHFIYTSRICRSLCCNFITKTWTKLPAQGHLYVRKHRINTQIRSVSAQPWSHTLLAQCLAIAILHLQKLLQLLRLGWSGMETQKFPPGLPAGALQVWMRSTGGFMARPNKTAGPGLKQTSPFEDILFYEPFSLQEENHLDLGFPSFLWQLIHLIAS